jgi:arsenate reductase
MMSTNSSITLFGIPNCDTVKKARTWMEQQNIPFAFHNFKKDGLTREQVELWLQEIDLTLLINRKGTTWRALSEEQKSSAEDKDGAIELMLTNPSVIKRPVLQINSDTRKHVSVGFNDQQYQTIFKEV